MLTYDATDSLHRAAFETRFPRRLGELPPPPDLVALLREDAPAPVSRTEELRSAVRALLREGGYKPSGRGKPSAEYLVRAIGDQQLPSINLAVDACNVASYHSGIPISVVDLERAVGPYSVGLPEGGSTYVFNASGQEIGLTGLLCLADGQGPCANAVKDCQRTKTSDSTIRTLSVLWGPAAHADVVEAALAWYRELLERAGAETLRVGES